MNFLRNINLEYPRKHSAYSCFLIILLSFVSCFSPDIPIDHNDGYKESSEGNLVGPRLSMSRIVALYANVEKVEGDEATELFTEAVESLSSAAFETIGLVKLSYDKLDIIPGDSLLSFVSKEGTEIVNCIRTFNEKEEYRSFELILPESPELPSSTAYLILYAHVFQSGNYIFGLSELSDTSLYVHDLYEASQSMGKPSDPDLYLDTPWYAPTGMDGTCDDQLALVPFYYESLVGPFTMQFFGDEFLQFMSEAMIVNIADNLVDMNADDVINRIRHLEGIGGYNELVSHFLSRLYIGARPFLSIYSFFTTWESFQDAVKGTIKDMDEFRECIDMDISFVRTWCGDRENFPYSSSYEGTLVHICQDWERTCSNLDDDFFVQNGFALSQHNRGRLCNDCRYQAGYLENDMAPDMSLDDYDGDGVPNDRDLCPCQHDELNFDIVSEDGHIPDHIGDACQDIDEDGVFDRWDNCLWTYNPEQGDIDNDGIGDMCDEDIYGENIEDCFRDTDGDGLVDCIDPCISDDRLQVDEDNDGVGDYCDNCNMWNPDQSYNPCLILPPPIIDENCSPEEIEEDMQPYYDFLACASNAGLSHTLPPPRVIESGAGNPNEKFPRKCILDKLSRVETYSHPAPQILCEWWEHNPAKVVLGVSLADYWGNEYYTLCDAEDPIDLSEWSQQISAIMHCCLSNEAQGKIDNMIATYSQILACFPPTLPPNECVDLKLTMTQLKTYYRNQLNYWKTRRTQTDGRISVYCTSS